MKLRSSPFSPFGRKVKIAAALVGLSERIAVEEADTMNPADTIRSQNPLGKIPALILDDGTAIYDSRVIVEFLDVTAGGGKLIPNGLARIPSLVMQATADGLMDACLLQRYEAMFRTEEARNAKWLDHQRGKVERTLAVLEKSPPADGDRTVGAVSVACALGYLDLRFDGTWRENNPKLVAWLDGFAAAVPAYAASAPS
jgi:glutathione S-transferase